MEEFENDDMFSHVMYIVPIYIYACTCVYVMEYYVCLSVSLYHLSELLWCSTHEQQGDLNILRLFSVDEQLLENVLKTFKNLNALLTFWNENNFFKYIRINVGVASDKL